MTTDRDTKRVGYVAGLRQLADLLEAHDIIPLPYQGTTSNTALSICCATWTTDEETRQLLADVVRVLPGTVDKVVDGDYYRTHVTLAGLHVQAWAMRSQVCERIVTGTETVTEEVPDPDALAKVPTTTVTREVEQVEWRCHPLLADTVKAAHVRVSS